MTQTEIDTGLGKLMIPELTKENANKIIVAELDRRINIVCGFAMATGAPQEFITDSKKQHVRYEHLKSIVGSENEKDKTELTTAVRGIAFDAFLAYCDAKKAVGESSSYVIEIKDRAAKFFAAVHAIEK